MQPKAVLRRTGPTTAAVDYSGFKLPVAVETRRDTSAIIEEGRPFPIPSDWVKGQLLNVRNTGADYTVTLFPEEFDPRHPERALRFTNTARCQDFVSHWYTREHSDPRAF